MQSKMLCGCEGCFWLTSQFARFCKSWLFPIPTCVHFGARSVLACFAKLAKSEEQALSTVQMGARGTRPNTKKGARVAGETHLGLTVGSARLRRSLPEQLTGEEISLLQCSVHDP
jgi:hypothetical protein